jgi:hypothetical protein
MISLKLDTNLEQEIVMLIICHDRAPRDDQKGVPSRPVSRSLLSRPVPSRFIFFLGVPSRPVSPAFVSRPVYPVPPHSVT